MEEPAKSTLKVMETEVSELCQLLPEIQQVNIEFQDITYTVNSTGIPKQILRGVSGSFRSGELTAVLGPSGAGKTTLLNLLAGYSISVKGTSGTVLVNGHPRHPLRFRRMCCYIMQDALMQECLSVMEVMLVASRLKVAGLNYEERCNDIMSILRTLGIDSCINTRTEVLSGGQKKRLTIACELVSNPSVLFLDEPTTGLDTHASKLVMRALAALADQGRTIVCTVHQPSPLEFRAYHHVYVIARGSCVYSGTPSELVPFLQEAETPCPTTYSPADYIIELIQMNPEHIDHLATLVKSKQNQNKPGFVLYNGKGSAKLKPATPPPSAWIQMFVLLRRMMVQRMRHKTQLRMQLIHHILSAVLIGTVFYGIGNEASRILENVKFVMTILVFYMYTYVMVSVLHFPLEVELIKREYFNNWYKPLPYFLSYSISSIPIMIPNVILFTILSYCLSGQPMEFTRVSYMFIMACLICYCSEGLGLLIGAFGNIKAGSLLGPTVTAAFYCLSMYGIGFGPSIEEYMSIIMKFTYIRYSLAGLWLALFGLERQQLDCNDLYCHWKEPSLMLRDMGVSEYTPWICAIGLLIYSLLYRVLGYIAIRYRLHMDLPGSNLAVLGVAQKVISHFRKQENVK